MAERVLSHLLDQVWTFQQYKNMASLAGIGLGTTTELSFSEDCADPATLCARVQDLFGRLNLLYLPKGGPSKLTMSINACAETIHCTFRITNLLGFPTQAWREALKAPGRKLPPLGPLPSARRL